MTKLRTLNRLQWCLHASACGQIEIISCDNEESRLEPLNPRPASIDIEAVEIGRRAVRRLLIRLQHPEESPVRVLVPPKLPEEAGRKID